MQSYAKTSSAVQVANKIKKAANVTMPRLVHWNYGPCPHHETPNPKCEYRMCGNDFFAHQRVSIMWLYAIKKGLVASSPGTGKAQPVWAKVLTPQGWREIGSLQPGDEVYTPSRDITRVKSRHPQGIQPIYRIHMNFGEITHATPEHLWKVGQGTDEYQIMTTQQIKDSLPARPMLHTPPIYDPKKKWLRKKYFKQIEEAGWEECICIALESKEQLYITDDYIITHNTNVILGLLCLLKEKNEIPRRSVIVVNTPSVKQWEAEAKRFAPGLKVAAIPGGTKKKERIELYGGSWDVLIIGYHLMLRDLELIKKIKPSALLTDDVDPILNETKVHRAIVELSEDVDRVVVSNASSIATDLLQIYNSMKPIDGKYIWGPKQVFEDNFVQKDWQRIKVGTQITTDDQGRRVMKPKYVNQSKVRGVRNGKVFRDTLDPWYIRYTYDDINDVAMPSVAPITNVWLDMHPEQRKRYTELRNGVLKLMKESGEREVKEVQALQCFLYGQMLTAGLPVLGEEDGPGKSIKFDWLCAKMRTDWKDEKVICFVRNKKAIRALEARFDGLGIGYAEVSGNKVGEERQAEITRFWEDPNCKVIFCSAAGVRSLNLQCARIVCFLDIPSLNPESVHQAIGRARRTGGHDIVYPFFLFCNDTQEDHYEEVLQQRETISRWVWDSEDHLLPKMSSNEIMKLILP